MPRLRLLLVSLLLVTDVFFVWLMVVFKPEVTTERFTHKTLVAMGVCGVLLVETVLSGTGCLLDKGRWQRLFYIGHCLVIWVWVELSSP